MHVVNVISAVKYPLSVLCKPMCDAQPCWTLSQTLIRSATEAKGRVAACQAAGRKAQRGYKATEVYSRSIGRTQDCSITCADMDTLRIPTTIEPQRISYRDAV